MVDSEKRPHGIMEFKGLTPVSETGIKTPFKSKQPVVGIVPATGYLVSFECELSYSK